jgi:glycosyltransferase involved in cell wall biosynthesis
MQIVHSIPSLIPESGGPARSVTGLCTALAYRGLSIDLISLDVGPHFGSPIIPPPELVSTTFVPNRLAVGMRQLWAPQFKQTLQRIIQEKSVRIIHDHCLWLPTNGAAAKTAGQLSIPLIVSTRGMLEPWALQHSRWKKWLMWQLYQRRNLAGARALHATSLTEAENLRRLGLSQPIAVIPNGVEIPAIFHSNGRPNQPQKRTLLFLSRLHPKKGLLNLVQAVKQLAPLDWQIILAGPDEGGHRAEVEAAIRAAGLSHSFIFTGPVDDTQKWALYRQADLFVLPSFSENFGIVIAEALAGGVPVITTTGTPWQELDTHHCGWCVEPIVESLATALGEAMSLTDTERRQMGLNGCRLIQHKYSWPAVAEQMAAVYRWVLGLGDRPACVITA